MPDKYPIRNIHIEDKHPTVIAGEVTTRPMTPEEWVKYGPKSEKKQKTDIHLHRPCEKSIGKEHEPVKKKLNVLGIIDLAKIHTLSKDGREAIAKEFGVTRVDVSNFINRPYVKKALIEAGFSFDHVKPRTESERIKSEAKISLEADSNTENLEISEAGLINAGKIGSSLGIISNTLLNRKEFFLDLANFPSLASNVEVLVAYVDAMKERINRATAAMPLDPVDIAYIREIFIAIGCASITGIIITN